LEKQYFLKNFSISKNNITCAKAAKVSKQFMPLFLVSIKGAIGLKEFYTIEMSSFSAN